MFISKKELKHIYMCIKNQSARIAELEKIVNNQPIIKKYQKTLDIFLKNAQD